jgi:phospholipid-transporting ATPase
LTGDKTETSVDIARSCHLFTESTTLAYVTGAESEEKAYAQLMDAKRSLEGAEQAGLVLDGMTVKYCLGSDRCEEMLLELGLSSRSCVCARLNPLQKRKLVDIVQHANRKTITLAIGDGANDVSMIEGAHVGVAVRGKEGAQAVNVSDVAISQFRFLVPLLLCHGRRAYRRVALYLCYYLYKNVALLMGDICWMIMDNYKGRIAFPEYLSINYNVFFTSWHILFVLGFDNDVPDAVAMTHPELYSAGPQRRLFGKYVFTKWMVYAVYHGCAAWMVSAVWIIDDATYDKKVPGQFWEGSITAFAIIIFVVVIKLLLHCESPLKFKTSILPTLGAILCFFVILGCLAYIPPGPSLQPSMEGIPADLLGNTNALIAMAIVPLAITSIDMSCIVARRCLNPSELDRLQASLRNAPCASSQ